MQKYIEKADILIEALPYIQKFNGTVVVIKYGGSAMTDEKIKQSVIGDISFMKMVGIKPIVVHGGGPFINEALKKSNIAPKFKNGLRITDENTIKIAESVLSGNVNKSIVSDFQKHGMQACGISGKDGKLIVAKKSDENIGYVGEIEKINPKIINTLIDNDFVPVISPIGTDEDGNTYNINADYAANELAIALKANKLVFMTDIDGLLEDQNDKKTLISKVNLKTIDKMIKEGRIKGGMIPKIKSCKKAFENGVKSVHIINGNIKHALLLEIYTNEGIGTIIEKD
ncbi:MAG: acetylglutamate kinase [Candidatus Melainabacteria bacterium LEY3_CP_29_8]|nr:MAG: acetylglutamate kinase [Candidatus Melainabacteria bacterium LEY3_CP_29_8]